MTFATNEVTVAAIGAAALMFAALIAAVPAIITSITNRSRIGKPNGRGNLTEMIGAALEESAEAKRLAADAVMNVTIRHKENERRLDRQDRALQRIEMAVRAALMDRGIADPE